MGPVHRASRPRVRVFKQQAWLRDGGVAWPRSVCSQAGQRWPSWVLVAGSVREYGSARASPLDTCDDRTTLPDSGKRSGNQWVTVG